MVANQSSWRLHGLLGVSDSLRIQCNKWGSCKGGEQRSSSETVLQTREFRSCLYSRSITRVKAQSHKEILLQQNLQFYIQIHLNTRRDKRRKKTGRKGCHRGRGRCRVEQSNRFAVSQHREMLPCPLQFYGSDSRGLDGGFFFWFGVFVFLFFSKPDDSTSSG